MVILLFQLRDSWVGKSSITYRQLNKSFIAINEILLRTSYFSFLMYQLK